MRCKNCFSPVVLAVLLILSTGCGSYSSKVHNCEACAPATFLFATESGGIAGFTLSSSGAPSPNGSYAGPNESEGIVADSSGSFLYVSDFLNDEVNAFTVNPATGALTTIAGSPFPAGSAPGAGGLAIDPGAKVL